MEKNQTNKQHRSQNIKEHRQLKCQINAIEQRFMSGCLLVYKLVCFDHAKEYILYGPTNLRFIHDH